MSSSNCNKDMVTTTQKKSGKDKSYAIQQHIRKMYDILL